MAIAGPGHDHSETPAQTTGSAPPRFAAASEDLELVGIVNGTLVTLYLDRFKDNSPVNDAEIEIDMAGYKYKAEKHSDGEYEVILKDMLKPSVMAITATIKTSNLVDLLATELDLHSDKNEQTIRFSWKDIAVWIGLSLLALIALGAIGHLRQKTRRT
ncbi:hypothetical protein DU000_11125 [Parvibium lacunae]|uniref:Uncharacterized protein n=1 Tax=Parvibium lacunae TaxID=1888893 RepID=A0A368L0E5_9BURK|nr:hypothetical protein DU000_11125 [Parvibium lacunae]